MGSAALALLCSCGPGKVTQISQKGQWNQNSKIFYIIMCFEGHKAAKLRLQSRETEEEKRAKWETQLLKPLKSPKACHDPQLLLAVWCPAYTSLKTVLTCLLSGRAEDHTANVWRIVNSLGHDICKAVTKGQWKQPKHMLICRTLRYLFRSWELPLWLCLITLKLHRFTMELKTAIAKAMQEFSSLLSIEIVINPAAPLVFHSEFGTFDHSWGAELYRPFPGARREFGTSIAPCRLVRLRLPFNRGKCSVISLDNH